MQASDLFAPALERTGSRSSSLDGQAYIIKSVVDAMDLGPDSAVVEFGAGTGDFTLPIARRLEELDGRGVVFGLDMSERLIAVLDQRAVERGLDLRIRAVPLSNTLNEQFPIRDGKVDRVLCVNTLQYLEDPSAVYQEIRRVLKPGGALCVVDWRRAGLHPFGARGESVFINKARSDIAAAGLHKAEIIEQQPTYWIVRAQAG